MSLYSEYIKEREGFDCIEKDQGFITYKVFGEECYVRDVYVKPEARKTSLASKMCYEVNDAAKKAGCKYLSGTVYSTYPYSSENTASMLQFGFKIAKVNQDVIWFKKDII